MDIIKKYGDWYPDSSVVLYTFLFDKERGSYIWSIQYYRATLSSVVIDAITGDIILNEPDALPPP
jgi:hypothetical protein